MDTYTPLTATTRLPDRPFTHPDHSSADIMILGRVADVLRAALTDAATGPLSPRTTWHTLDGRDCRLVLAQREPLLTKRDLLIVGFFGQKRPNADPAPLDAVDDELIGEFGQHPGVLSYCSHQLQDGNWGNLVVLGFEEAREHWRTSERHAYAVRDLAPGYYATIRLHNAKLQGGLFSSNPIHLLRTKYYDFQVTPAWRAVREFVAA